MQFIRISRNMPPKRKISSIGGGSKSTKAKVIKTSGKKLPKGWADFRNGDDSTNVMGPTDVTIEDPEGEEDRRKEQLKSGARKEDGRLIFKGYPTFQPNKTPREVIESGAFGGCYFRPIKSAVLPAEENRLKHQHKEFDFFKDIPDELLCLREYSTDVNKFKVTCGGSLQMWQSKGWIAQSDPYGIAASTMAVDVPTMPVKLDVGRDAQGRWKSNLMTKIMNGPGSLQENLTDHSISPVVRQTLLHWGYQVTLEDLEEYVKRKK